MPETSALPRIGIAGATGYIGGRLAPQLLELGYGVRCLARTPAKLQDREWSAHEGLEIRGTDFEDVASIAKSLEGCESAFYLVHSIISAGADYARRDRFIAANFASAARQAGIQRIVYLGGLGETGKDLSEHLSSRREVESALAATGVPVTVLRAAMILGSGSASFEMMRYLVERLPIMITPKWVSTPCQPIAVRNVLEYLVKVLSVPETVGEVFDVGGPDVRCYEEIMRVMAEELGLRRRWIVRIPCFTPRLSSYWIHLVTPLSDALARPLTEGLKNPVVCREDRIKKLIPQKLLSVRESVQAALAKTAERSVPTSWLMAGAMPGDPDWAGGKVFRDERQIAIDAPARAVFSAVCRVGGRHGWYAANWLWTVRGWIDVLAGGPGLRRGRRDPEKVGYGEALDFWRVVGFDRDRKLALRAEMKLPGEALLDFRIVAQSADRSTLQQLALFRPRGLFGLLYWFAVSPLHHIVFRGMLRGIRREALRMAALSKVVLSAGRPIETEG